MGLEIAMKLVRGMERKVSLIDGGSLRRKYLGSKDVQVGGFVRAEIRIEERIQAVKR